jgi:hypothetical protein
VHYVEATPKGRNIWECDRLELNAFTAAGLVAFLEDKLRRAGATAKVIPPAGFLEKFSRRTYANAMASWVPESLSLLIGLNQIIDVISRQFERKLRVASPKRLAKAFSTDRSRS